jgi:hypothetical protein
MGYVRHTYDSPTPNEEHEVELEIPDVDGLQEANDDAEALNLFLQL